MRPRQCCIDAKTVFNIPEPGARIAPIAAVNAPIYVASQDYSYTGLLTHRR